MPISDQGRANIVLARPFGMLRDRRHNTLRHAGFRENLQDLAFRKERVAECELDRLRISLGQERSNHSRWTTPRHGQFLPHRQVRYTRDDQLFRDRINKAA
jgi:hypothetical protein